MKNTDDELTDADLDALADQGDRLLKGAGKQRKLSTIVALILLAALAWFVWWQTNSFEVLQHLEPLWGWTW